MKKKQENEYLEILLEPIRICARYMPKFGKGNKAGFVLSEFQKLYGADPFYSWFGLDNPMMYAAHKAAGGITSVYRQIGIACERLFRQVLMDRCGLTEEQAKWSYKIKVAGGRERKLSLDGRIELKDVADKAVRKRVEDWMKRTAKDLKVNSRVSKSLIGCVFEVRQGYKSKDSKRQNADIANATNAYTNAYLPCVVVFSAQIDDDIQLRYRNAKWALLTGTPGEMSDLRSTYVFLKDVIGYDMEGFFKRHSKTLKTEVEKVLRNLLKTK